MDGTLLTLAQQVAIRDLDLKGDRLPTWRDPVSGELKIVDDRQPHMAIIHIARDGSATKDEPDVMSWGWVSYTWHPELDSEEWWVKD